DLIVVDQMLAGEVDRNLELALARHGQPVLQLLAGVAQYLVIQLLNKSALLRQRDEVEGILEYTLLRDPASHHLQPGQTTVLEPDHRLEIRHYAPLSQGSGQHLLR